MRPPAHAAPALAPALALAFALFPAALLAGQDDAVLAASAYTLDSSPGPIKLKKGEAGRAHFAVVPKAGAHVSPEAPVTIKLSGGPAIEIPKVKLGRADTKATAAQGIEVELPFTAKSAGQEELKADVVFFICVKDLCARQQKSLSFAVTIE